HFADSLGVPCLGLYGPTSTVSWGLLGINSQTFSEPVACSPCYLDTGEFPNCPYEIKCMTELTPERVLVGLKATRL
ncbi:MAG: lipopolysaccharide heptosyltransferase I, partial [Bdellovibrionia bacterium]